ncbi:(2Fe-2S)-binding protein [Thalassiella azotivora]
MCHCEVVSDRQLRAAVDDGASTLAELCRRTGAGQSCGGCVFTVKAVLCQHGVAHTPSRGEVPHATREPASGGAAQLGADVRADGHQHVLPARQDAGQLGFLAAG